MSLVDFQCDVGSEAWVAVGGSFAPNGASAVSAASNNGDGWSVARTSTGLFTVTFSTVRANLIHAHAWLQLASAANSRVQMGTYTASTGALQIRVLTGALTAGSHAADVYTAGVHAVKTITFPVLANITNETTITAYDGFNKVIFGLDTDNSGVAGDDVTVNLSTATTAADVAALFYTAINASSLMGWAYVDNLNGTITCTHKVAGTVGNQPWQVQTDADVTVVNTVTGAYPTFASGAFVAPSYSDAVADIAANASNRINFLAIFGQQSANNP